MQSTIDNRTIFCRDNLEILAGIDSESIDLIYLDPPFNKKKVFTAPIGSSAEGASFSDIFREEDVKEEWVLTIEEDNEKLHNFLLGIRQIDGRQSYNFCYLCYMSIRLIACQRVLKETGSLYLHCDPTMSHYIKIVLDCVFGEQHFRNEITWHYGKWSNVSKDFQKNHDIIFRYSKSDACIFNGIYYSDMKSKMYHTNVIKGQGQLLVYDKNIPEGIINKYKQKDYKIVYVENKGVLEHDVWTYLRDKKINILNSQSKERTGYPTQKPLALLERIIKASCPEGGTVLDPFCGCATTCIAAERLGRQWIGIDVSVKAYELVEERLQKEVSDPEDLFKHQNVVNYSTSAPKRTDLEDDYLLKKWVYVISNEAYCDEYKVGIARNWKSRLNSYQTSDPNRGYKIEYKKLTPHFRELEKHIHTTFENRHEWVTGDLHDIIKEIEDFL